MGLRPAKSHEKLDARGRVCFSLPAGRQAGGGFSPLPPCEQRISRTIERNMAELRTLRAERKAAREQALEEALLLAQLAQSKGEKYDAAADFPPELLGEFCFLKCRNHPSDRPGSAPERGP
jgi:hypothetical protein